MKHFFTFLLTLVVTLGWAQKKELKQAQKLYKSAKISEAKASLDANQAPRFLGVKVVLIVMGYQIVKKKH